MTTNNQANQQTLEILNDETVIEAAERTAPNTPTDPVKETAPAKRTQEKQEFFGQEVCYDKSVGFNLKEIRGLSKYVYTHDIHVANPNIIDTVCWVNLKDHRHVMLRITPELFDTLAALFGKKNILYVYNSINEHPRMRQYVKQGDDRWPTVDEIDKMDVEISKMPGQDTWVSRDRRNKAEKNVVRHESTKDTDFTEEETVTSEEEVPAGS